METIHLKTGDWLGIDKRGLYRVNHNTFYNPRYYNLTPETQTQRDIINRITPQPQEIENKGVDFELKQLTIMDHLKKKIISYNNFQDKLQDAKQYGNEDKIILVNRSLIRAKNLIMKYHNQLKEDINFGIDYVGDTTYKMVYSGKYVNATKQGELSKSLGVF